MHGVAKACRLSIQVDFVEANLLRVLRGRDARLEPLGEKQDQHGCFVRPLSFDQERIFGFAKILYGYCKR